ncbi:MAG: hypothetical protein HY815_33925 [Candidatus Riflebacteria bacterium]|nr:hypothetical protein [Candidatus Riflebacteria bacterium]
MSRFEAFGVLVALVLGTTAAFSAGPTDPRAAFEAVKRAVASGATHRMVLSPEGQFVAVFNRDVEPWVRQKIDLPLLLRIRARLAPHLVVKLTDRGFARAAAREVSGEKDETNYDAVWVRDSVWIFYSFVDDPSRRQDARKLLLALWDYYATDAQVARFEAVIDDRSSRLDAMAMPHIRFDASSREPGDVMVGGRPETWNHRQMDAHGLFFTALGEAVERAVVGANDLTGPRFKLLSLYPRFVEAVEFTTYEDAGAWEELPRKNTSSIGLVTRSLQVWKGVLTGGTGAAAASFDDAFRKRLRTIGAPAARAWSERSLDAMISRGLRTVKRQLAIGGESPDYAPGDVRFRLADAALLALLVPSPLAGLTEDERRKALGVVETLRRPMGFLRYENDSYQCGNYWIRQPDEDSGRRPTLTGDTSSREAFLWRLGQLTPGSEAQWFFDSLLALARLGLARTTDDPRLGEQDVHAAAVHLKRALGQLTGDPAVAADGKSVRPLQPPESINTVIIDGHRYHLPSPITPLNWARAGLSMALGEYERYLKEPPAPGRGP